MIKICLIDLIVASFSNPDGGTSTLLRRVLHWVDAEGTVKRAYCYQKKSNTQWVGIPLALSCRNGTLSELNSVR